MKQTITEEQYNELSEDKKQFWHEWAMTHGFRLSDFMIPGNKSNFDDDIIISFPSIGQMIEFLGANWFNLLFTYDQMFPGDLEETIEIVPRYKGELCDALWMEVKEKLNVF